MKPKQFFVLLFAGALVSCANPTEIVVFVDTSLGVPCALDAFQIDVEGATTVSRTVAAAEGLSSVTIAKDGGNDRIVVRVTGKKGDAAVASAVVSASFEARTSQGVFVTLSDACVPGPCDFSADVGALQIPQPSTRTVCEPVVDRYRFEENGFLQFVDACDVASATQEIIAGINNAEVELTSPSVTAFLSTAFAFTFFGAPVTRVLLSDNGTLRFNDDAGDARLPNTDNGLSSAGTPQNAILPFWDNLQMRASSEICAAVVTAAGQDTLWLTWRDMCFDGACDAGDHLTFSVGLEEGTNRVSMVFEEMTSTSQADRARGSLAVSGVTHQRSTCDACSFEGLCADGTPCGYTEIFSHAQQPTWPTTFVLTPFVTTF
jgi:hypothetical protein